MIRRLATVARKVPPGQDTKSISRQTCEADAPHLIVEVIPTSATMADGDIVGELHARLEEQQMLPAQHLMDMGYVDAEVLAESQSRYQVDIVGPVMPDTSWASKEAGRFDHRQFQIDWQTHQAICPAGHTSRDWGYIPDRHGQPSLRVRFPTSTLPLLSSSHTMYPCCSKSLDPATR